MKKGWPAKRLGDVCEIIMGQSPDGESYNTTGEGVPLINGPVEFSRESFGKTVRSKFTTQPAKFCKEGDLILCVRGSTTGRMNIAGFDACVGRGVAALRAKQYQPWINHFISSKRDEIHGRGTGATFPNVSSAMLADFELVIPPLSEQQRIVTILDEAFERIATAKANAEKNLQNARAIFQSHLQSVFARRGKGWAEKTLGDFCSFENGDRGTNYPSKSVRSATGVPFINAGHLTEDGIDLETMDYIPRERFDLLSNGKIRKGDILFCLRGSLGKFASVGDLDEGAIASSLVIVRPDKTVLNEYLAAYFRSSLCADMIYEFKNGAAQPNLSAQSLRKFVTPVPPLPEQKVLVGELVNLREETQRLARLYETKLAAFEALKKSLLHQAFSGNL